MPANQVYISFVLTDLLRFLSTAVGGLLCQRDDSGTEYPISFFSCKLTDTQRNWATIEREAYAVLVAVRKFKHWFFGSKLIIHSDHNPITYLTASAPKSSKLMRWSMALAQFDIEFQFKAEKMNVPADTLSRPGSGAFNLLGVCKYDFSFVQCYI